MMTYKELYFKYKTIANLKNKEESAIKILIQELSGFSSTDFYLHYENEVSNDLELKIQKAIDEYLNEDIPVQYILGYTYFYGCKLNVNKNVLIPRRETEELVDWIIKNNKILNPHILDIGTGSGAIAIALNKHIKNAITTAVDISKDALVVAIINAKLNNQDINFIESDVFSNVNGKFNIIVSNPPYIDKIEDVEELVLKNEPHLALFAKNQGLYFYEKIIKEASNYLESKSLIAFEIPDNKDAQLQNIVNKYYPNSINEIIKDLQGRSRILIIKNNWR
jgi:release factor glutamine methyltransferase